MIFSWEPERGRYELECLVQISNMHYLEMSSTVFIIHSEVIMQYLWKSTSWMLLGLWSTAETSRAEPHAPGHARRWSGNTPKAKHRYLLLELRFPGSKAHLGQIQSFSKPDKTDVVFQFIISQCIPFSPRISPKLQRHNVKTYRHPTYHCRIFSYYSAPKLLVIGHEIT